MPASKKASPRRVRVLAVVVARCHVDVGHRPGAALLEADEGHRRRDRLLDAQVGHEQRACRGRWSGTSRPGRGGRRCRPARPWAEASAGPRDGWRLLRAGVAAGRKRKPYSLGLKAVALATRAFGVATERSPRRRGDLGGRDHVAGEGVQGEEGLALAGRAAGAAARVAVARADVQDEVDARGLSGRGVVGPRSTKAMAGTDQVSPISRVGVLSRGALAVPPACRRSCRCCLGSRRPPAAPCSWPGSCSRPEW